MWHLETFLLKFTLRTGAIVAACFTLINCLLLVGAIFIFPVATEAQREGQAGLTGAIFGSVLVLNAVLGIIVFVRLVFAIVNKAKFALMFSWLIWQVITIILFAILVVTDLLLGVYYTSPILVHLLFMCYMWFVINSFYWRLHEEAEYQDTRRLRPTKSFRSESFRN